MFAYITLANFLQNHTGFPLNPTLFLLPPYKTFLYFCRHITFLNILSYHCTPLLLLLPFTVVALALFTVGLINVSIEALNKNVSTLKCQGATNYVQTYSNAILQTCYKGVNWPQNCNSLNLSSLQRQANLVSRALRHISIFKPLCIQNIKVKKYFPWVSDGEWAETASEMCSCILVRKKLLFWLDSIICLLLLNSRSVQNTQYMPLMPP